MVPIFFMNFGVPSYPLTRRKKADLVAGEAKSVMLDMLWDSHTVLGRRDESEVKFSEVAGKRIILLIWIDWLRACSKSLSILKSKYNLMKGTDDEFEVIQIFDLRELSDYKEHAADVPWLIHPFDEGSHELSLLLGASGDARILAFNSHGQVVSRVIYVHNTRRTKEKTFWKKFKTMPWLALPFKDPVINKLRRICHYPQGLEGPAPDPRLVIVGPRGEYFEPYGADIFMNFYPFTHRKKADLVAGEAKSVMLDMLWDSHTVLGRRDKSEVKFSEVAGKRIILLIGINWVRAFAESLSILESKYDLMKGTYDEFEVIQIFDLGELSECSEHAEDVLWLVHPFDEDLPGLSLLLDASGDARLLAFNSHGQVVRRATYPLFEVGEDSTFPIYAAGDLEKEVYTELYKRFSWIYWHKDSIFHM